MSLFRNHANLIERPTPVRPSSRPSTSTAPATSGSGDGYKSWKIQEILIKAGTRFTAEGPSVLSDVDDYQMSIRSACKHARAPAGMYDLLDMTEDSVEKTFDEELNDDLFMVLFDTTEPRSRARQYVMKYKHTRDGRRAWLAINKACMALTSAKRSSLREKVESTVIDTKKHPEEQFNSFMLLIQQLEDARGQPLSQVDLEDYVLGFIRRAESTMYDRVVITIEDDIDNDRFDPIRVCDELSKTYDNAQSKRRERQSADKNPWKPREKEQAAKAASIQDQGYATPKESSDDKPQHPCIVCESHGLDDQFHKFKDCPKVQEARQRSQQKRGGEPEDTPNTPSKAKSSKVKRSKWKTRGAKKAAVPEDDNESIPDSEFDPADVYEMLGAKMARPLQNHVTTIDLSSTPTRVNAARTTKEPKFSNSVVDIVMWLIDTGCGVHTCGNKALFSNIDTSKKTKIELADKTVVWTHGIGDVYALLQDQHGEFLLVHFINVHYIPGAQNCLSVRQLFEHGFNKYVDFGKGILRKRSHKFAFTWTRDGYYLPTRPHLSRARVSAPQAIQPHPAAKFTSTSSPPSQEHQPAPVRRDLHGDISHADFVQNCDEDYQQDLCATEDVILSLLPETGTLICPTTEFELAADGGGIGHEIKVVNESKAQGDSSDITDSFNSDTVDPSITDTVVSVISDTIAPIISDLKDLKDFKDLKDNIANIENTELKLDEFQNTVKLSAPVDNIPNKVDTATFVQLNITNKYNEAY